MTPALSMRDFLAGRPHSPPTRPSHDTRHELPHHEYNRRCEEVYWCKAPACRSKGPHGARCVRFPDHAGICEGNGNPDPYGPKYYSWTRKR